MLSKKLITFAFVLSNWGLALASQPIQTDCTIWNKFVETQKTGKECLLLDFSFAGYKHGEVDIPNVKHKIFNVCDFGAIPNDNKSDRTAFEKAIKAAEMHESGIIYFPKGRFDLRKENDAKEEIKIHGSNIVIRGEGNGKNGTELFMEYPNPAKNPKKLYSSPCLISFDRGKKDKILTTVIKDAARGSFNITVASASEIKKGDWIHLYVRNTNPNVIAEELSPYKVDPTWKQIIKEGVMIDDYHLVEKVKGNVITLKEPLMHNINKDWIWTVKTYPSLYEIGVEDIAFIGNWKDKFKHHKNWLHDGGWKPLKINNAVNSWVRRCRFTDINEGLSIIACANVSVTDCIITGNAGHSAIRAQSSSRVFLGKIKDTPAQWHSVGFSKPSIGTVLWRIKTNNNSCFESHASQPRASLIDASEGGFSQGHAGGAVSSNPNHLNDLVIWNYKETDKPSSNFEFWPSDTKFWKFLPPIIVGFHGTGTTFNKT